MDQLYQLLSRKVSPNFLSRPLKILFTNATKTNLLSLGIQASFIGPPHLILGTQNTKPSIWILYAKAVPDTHWQRKAPHFKKELH